MPDPACAEDLYALAPEAFVAARDALVKDLRARGKREDAQRMAKLRRPTASAAALNHVARSAPDLIARLLTSGKVLRQAMADAVSGDAARLRHAEAEERSAVDAIISHAIRTGHSLTEPHRQRLIETLRAAVLDDEVAGLLENGTLDVDQQAPAFGFASIADLPTSTTGRSASDPAATARLRARKAEVAKLQAEAHRLTHRAERLQTDAAAARRRASDLEGEADRATAEAVAARARLSAAAD